MTAERSLSHIEDDENWRVSEERRGEERDENTGRGGIEGWETSGVTFSHASSRVPGFRWVPPPSGATAVSVS